MSSDDVQQQPDSDDAVDRLLNQIEKAAQIDAGNNARIMDNHLLHSDRVIASMAAMNTVNADLAQVAKDLLENPT